MTNQKSVVTRMLIGACICVFANSTQDSKACDVNGITTVCSGRGFEQLPDNIPNNVQCLDVSNNNIKELLKGTFEKFSNTRRLNVSHNLIHFIHQRAFFLLIDLETLDLSHNHLKHIQESVIYNNAKLKELFLSGNKEFSSVPKLSSKSLEKIHVSNCSIEYLNETVFEDVEYIKYLDLSYNFLTRIGSHTFDILNFISYLNLSHNHLEDVEFINNDISLSLGTLDISFNNIIRASNTSFNTFMSLNKSLVRSNPWICDEDMQRIYDAMMERELSLNLKCHSPFDAYAVRSWHTFHAKTEAPPNRETSSSTIDLPTTTVTPEVESEQICQEAEGCNISVPMQVFVGLNCAVTFITLIFVCYLVCDVRSRQ